MYETILLTEDNLHEVARKTGRSEVDLHDELATAEEENRVLFITCLTPHGLQEIRDALMHSDILERCGLSIDAFVELIKEDLERASKVRIDRLLRDYREQSDPPVLILSEATLDSHDLPGRLDLPREDLAEILETYEAERSTAHIRDPGQWLRAKQRKRSRRRS